MAFSPSARTTASILALLLAFVILLVKIDPGKEHIIALLLGIASSCAAGLLLPTTPFGRYSYLRNRREIFAAAKNSVSRLNGAEFMSVTSLNERLADKDKAEVDEYLRVISRKMLEKETEDLQYRVVGSYGLASGVLPEKSRLALIDRLRAFHDCRDRVQIRSFEREEPFDILILPKEIIIAFRSTRGGHVTWGFRIRDSIVASALLKWYTDILWEGADRIWPELREQINKNGELDQ